jgi:hypothetical protein
LLTCSTVWEWWLSLRVVRACSREEHTITSLSGKQPSEDRTSASGLDKKMKKKKR